MRPFEIKKALQSMAVIVDTREQKTERSETRYKAFDCPYVRRKLEYGDYTWMAELPDGKVLNGSDQVKPLCAVERKMDLDELANCFCKDRKRFEAEFERARDGGGRIFLLVENASWEKLIGHKYRSKMNPNSFLASITAYMARYGCSVIFCDELTSGRLIKEILYRDLKERLERGDFDVCDN